MADIQHRDEAHHDVVEHSDEPQDRPEDWGWHSDAGVLARPAGWIVAAMLLLMNLGNQTRHIENFWLTGVAALIVVILLLDRRRRKNAWRN